MIRVLLVEDDPMARQLLEIYVNKSENYELTGSVESALFAEVFCRTHPVDVILMDVCTAMNANGIDAAQDIKKHLPQIKIIIITSQPECSFIDRAREAGVDSFWYKSATAEEIITVMDRTLAGECIYPDSTPILKIMDENVISVSTLTDQEEVAQMLSKYNFLALPVVDGEGRMVGIVTFDDAMDVLEDEATEDMELMSGITPSEKTYLKSSAFDLFRNRAPWLMLLMVSATFTGLIITAFEGALAAQVALTAFIPMLMGTGGNSGSQSSVTVIRSLSLGEIQFKDIWHVIWKELRTAILCGVALGVVCFVKILLIDGWMMGNEGITLMVDAVVCLTLCVTVIIAKLVGCTLPLAAKALKLDPAVMASPFISTIVDALSLLVYFMFAKALLGV